jgi:hypothetical protein
MNFGAVSLTAGEEEFSRELNQEILSLCGSLPESTQVDAALFLMRYFRTSLEDGLNFFRNFHVPTWSVIYWLLQSCPNVTILERVDVGNGRIAHAMAMFLHILDDHLTDTQLPLTHLTLLLRSQAWMIMNHALHILAYRVDNGKRTIQRFIDDYYFGIRNSHNIGSLDSYCELFRKQMATGLIFPVLLAREITNDEQFASTIGAAYGSFGIAWRLLDDIQDMESDMVKGKHSSVYVCLSKKMKMRWDESAEQRKNSDRCYANAILNQVLENRVIDKIRERICAELESAADSLDGVGVAGLADELRCLLGPVRIVQISHE